MIGRLIARALRRMAGRLDPGHVELANSLTFEACRECTCCLWVVLSNKRTTVGFKLPRAEAPDLSGALIRVSRAKCGGTRVTQ